MGRITDKLNAINVDEENIDELYNIFLSIKDSCLPIIRFVFHVGAALIRQRINLPGQEFYKVSELSYPPDPCIVKGYERANLPYQPMFYACSFPSDYDDNKSLPPRAVALQETSSFYKDRHSYGIERCTVSRWEVVKELELVAMPFLAYYKMACQDINKIKEFWYKLLGNDSINQDGRELIEYMAVEIGKNFENNVEYFKIANFVNYLLNVNEKTKNADGIIYPSVPAAGTGFNVAIKPSIVDDKIKFVGVSLCHLLKRGDKAYMQVMNTTSSVKDGVITYKDKKMDYDEIITYQSYAEGLNFIN